MVDGRRFSRISGSRFLHDSDRTWRWYGRQDPYFGVRTDPRFRSSLIDADSREEFFDSGEAYVKVLFDDIRSLLGRDLQPKRALDFGCGVGRLTMPIARRSDAAVGVDISDDMLDAAQGRADTEGIGNVTFKHSDDELDAVSSVGLFDFVHSFIVFQHISQRRGAHLLSRMIDLLEVDGVGALHFTYSHASGTPLWRRALTGLYERLPIAFDAMNAIQRRPRTGPLMSIKIYDLNRLVRTLQESGCHKVALKFTTTSHFGFEVHGVTLYFIKRWSNTSLFG